MSGLPEKNSSGQALLIVLLSMAVVLTVVLSVLSLSITDVAVTSREEESLRAFSAAEAGVEQALITGSSSSSQVGEAVFTTNVEGVSDNLSYYVYPGDLKPGDSSTLWFVSHDGDGDLVCDATNNCFKGSQIRLCWGRAGTSGSSTTAPAIELTIYYLTTPGDKSSARLARVALDPNLDRRASNFFSAEDGGSCNISGRDFSFQKLISFSDLGIPQSSYLNQNGLQFAVVKTYYNSDSGHPWGVDVNFPGNSKLASQGAKIISVGTAGESTRKVEVFRLYSGIPSLFSSVLVSRGSIAK